MGVMVRLLNLKERPHALWLWLKNTKARCSIFGGDVRSQLRRPKCIWIITLLRAETECYVVRSLRELSATQDRRGLNSMLSTLVSSRASMGLESPGWRYSGSESLLFILWLKMEWHRARQRDFSGPFLASSCGSPIHSHPPAWSTTIALQGQHWQEARVRSWHGAWELQCGMRSVWTTKPDANSQAWSTGKFQVACWHY